MISELEKNIVVNNPLSCIKVKDYLFEQINYLPIGSEFTLKDLLPSNYQPKNSLNQLGREFACLIQRVEWTGILIKSENPNKYKKYDKLRKEYLFKQINPF